MITPFQIEEFKTFFAGAQKNYGEHSYGDIEQDGKRKGISKTVRDKLVTSEHYKAHLEGKQGLGIIPINERNNVWFSVIDIDIYDSDLSIFTEAIERNRFPLIPFKSKSGGLHIYIFFKEETPAIKAVELMNKMAFYLSIDKFVKAKKNTSVEIFPKQLKLSSKDVGSWINLPYFNASREPLTYAIREGKKLSLNDALLLIKQERTTFDDALEFLAGLEYNDAPPCLQNIYILNPLTSGNGRNNFLFSFGVYLKKKDEEFFEHKLLSINSHLRDPLDEKEVEKTIINSLKRKDYVYKCKDAPCVDFCNKKECKEREYGIGKNEGYFSNVEFGQLTQYKTHMPYYEWEVRLQGQEIFKKLRFKSEDEIIKQDAFLRLCMRELYEIPSKLKQTEWFKQVNQALKEITIITVDEVEDTSPIVLLKNLIVEFLTGRARAETKEQIKVKRVFYETSTDTYLFRIKDLLEFIFITKQFRMFTPQEIHAILKEMKVMTKFTKTESGKTLRVAMLPRSFIKEAVEEDEFEPDFSHLKEDF